MARGMRSASDNLGRESVPRPFQCSYEERYEVRSGAIFILRIWHTRESR